ncbi:hypothetical protein EW146_g4469 [Bondarzewia mesenterica]|uniref:RRM domain-containing protein n=1 Tax=Bondarzewia mesenterica TaxID=1095465 RepID=A0A4S4LWN6_9AGAM|nr:hypothetical protein EW146_g4469 [Bondarzewia mesenterica]
MTMQFRAGPARLNAYYGPKRQLLGTQPGQAAPAWRPANLPTGPNGSIASSSRKASMEQASKILLSHLPMDVGEAEVEELFKRTVGPMKDLFIVYNNQGNSKGMAIVTFQRPGDAAVARQKYNNKIVDGRHRIKIEIISNVEDPRETTQPPTAPAGPPSLLSRLGGATILAGPAAKKPVNSFANAPPTQPRALQQRQANIPITAGPRRRRQKKGAKRVKKSVAQLDQEMEDYRAGISSRGMSEGP